MDCTVRNGGNLVGNVDQKIILRFRNSSKAGTSQEIPAGKFPNITIGRDPSCEVRSTRTRTTWSVGLTPRFPSKAITSGSAT